MSGACALLLLAALGTADAQTLDAPASCAVADSVLGPMSAAQREAPLRRLRRPDGSEFARTGTQMLSESGIAIAAAWLPADSVTEIQLDVALPARQVRQRLLAQDTLFLHLDDRPGIPLGIPGTATIVGRPIMLPLMASLSLASLLELARAGTAQVRIGNREVRFSTVDRLSVNRLARLLLCAGRSA